MFEFNIKVAGEVLGINTHNMPHLDEVASACVVDWFGTKEFIDKYCESNILHLGVNGVFSDEHAVSGSKLKKKKECCLSLVIKALGVKNNPEFEKFKKIFKFTKANDTEGYCQCGQRDIASVLILLHRQHQDEESQLANIEWATKAIYVKYMFDSEDDDFTIDRIKQIAEKNQDKIDFDPKKWFTTGDNAITQGQVDFLTAVEEYKVKEKAGEILSTQIPFLLKKKKKAVQLKIVALRSDNYKMASAAKHKSGGGANFIIIQNSKGNISVLSRDWPNLHETASILRYEDQRKKGLIITDDWSELSSEGTVEGANWYLDKNLNAIYNGGFTHSEVPPTKLHLKEVFYAVYMGLSKQKLHSRCNGKFCVRKKCPMYPWGLNRCRNIRNQRHIKLLSA